MGGKRSKVLRGDSDKRLIEDAISRVVAIYLRIPADAEELTEVWKALEYGDINTAIKILLQLIKTRCHLAPEEEQLVYLALGITPEKLEKKTASNVRFLN